MVSKADKVPRKSLCAGIMAVLVGLLAAMPGSKAFGTAGCGGNPFVFLPAQLWLLLDEREQLLLTVAFQHAVQEFQVANPKHGLVQPFGPSSGPSRLCASEQLQPSAVETQPTAALYTLFDINGNVSTKVAHSAASSLLSSACLWPGSKELLPPLLCGLGPSAGPPHLAVLRTDSKLISKSQSSVQYTDVWEKRPDFKVFWVQWLGYWLQMWVSGKYVAWHFTPSAFRNKCYSSQGDI